MPAAPTPIESLSLCEECRERRRLVASGGQSPGARSRHVAEIMERGGGYKVCSTPPRWRLAVAIATIAAMARCLIGLSNLSVVLLAVVVRLGPMHFVLTLLPAVHSRADFDNRRYRVQQSLWLVSICCSVYTFIPEELAEAGLTGWKMNLVTMETSMASGIAATYGYSVAGGVPGGLLAEFVMSSLGKRTVAEISPYLGAQVGKASVSFVLFMVMGSYMEVCTATHYHIAHTRINTPSTHAYAYASCCTCGPTGGDAARSRRVNQSSSRSSHTPSPTKPSACMRPRWRMWSTTAAPPRGRRRADRARRKQ